VFLAFVLESSGPDKAENVRKIHSQSLLYVQYMKSKTRNSAELAELLLCSLVLQRLPNRARSEVTTKTSELEDNSGVTSSIEDVLELIHSTVNTMESVEVNMEKPSSKNFDKPSASSHGDKKKPKKVLGFYTTCWQG